MRPGGTLPTRCTRGAYLKTEGMRKAPFPFKKNPGWRVFNQPPEVSNTFLLLAAIAGGRADEN